MKKKSGNHLLGRTAMVNPNLTVDTDQRRGQTGKIISFFPEHELFTMSFKNGRHAVFAAHDLIILKPRKMILLALTSNLVIETTHCSLMLEIYKLKSGKKTERALKLAVTTPLTWFFCTVSCKGWLDFQKKG